MRPALSLLNTGVTISNPGAVLHDLDLALPSPALAYTFSLTAGTVERVRSDGREGAAGCMVERGLLRDSVCIGGLYASNGEPSPAQITLRNITADGLMVGAFGGATVSLDAANVISRRSEPGHEDVEINVSTGSKATATFANSNYATVGTTLSAGTDYTYTAPGTNGNQTAPPQFVNAAAGDYRPLQSSPTVDAGLAASLLGSLDLDGHLRSLPRCIGGAPVPDIGAYEFVPTANCPQPPPSNAIKFGALVRNKRKGTGTLTVVLPGPGRLSLAGKGVVARKARQVGAGRANLKIVAKGSWKRKLTRTGEVKLNAKVTFVPAGGEARTQTRRIVLRQA